ncbi:MAG TPA: FAD-dependent oxidoreductase [Steroidobacteraceae bacterium]|jgi:dimethylamine/trimethylamine dehydrogenase|nr:FAD-dependent oxidoreductase [Steroidobacteraceae bacterium]
MPREPRFDILFEPVEIGPVVAKNRFFQVPHCNGMGHARPHAHAAMRGVKAEGGWAVVSTEEVEIHPTSDVSPYIEGRLWDDADIPALALMTDAVHRHGALAAIELAHGGMNAPNLLSREVSLAPSALASPASFHPAQARAMSKSDIREFRRWHRQAALRARRAGFDVIYVYAAHSLSLPMHFLQRRHNHRSDEYGGSLANRARLLRELIEDTKEAVGAQCAVAVRFAVDELRGPDGIAADGEGREVVSLLAELPDLWDVNISDWAQDSRTSRFAPEGYQEEFVRFVKTVTTKPVVGVGRFTSPDAMVSQIRRGVLDFIGAARPSIADPFLPRKIESGEIDDIRECIGCNVCVSGDYTMTPIRCTQNPTMGEEWRKGWHPEQVPAATREDSFLIVGAGPSGLECARVLGRRGHTVHLVDAAEQLGGRVSLETRLPGLAAWARVRDYRVGQINKLAQVTIVRASPVSTEDILEFGAQRVVLATGARWRRDGVGRANSSAIPGLDIEGQVFTPEDVMAGRKPQSPAVIFDDDHYYLGGVIAEKLRSEGIDVTLVTPAAYASAWTINTLEQFAIQRRLLELGVSIRTNGNLVGFDGERAVLACTFTGRLSHVPAASVVTVTSRLPNDGLAVALAVNPDRLAQAGIASVVSIGDCWAPSTIAAAVYAGHRYAREFDRQPDEDAAFARELPAI